MDDREANHRNQFQQLHDDAHTEERAPLTVEQMVQQIKETADKLIRDGANRGDVKLLTTAFKELRYCFKVFAAYRRRRKVTVFGSARLRPAAAAYQVAVAFSQRMSEAGYMVMPGAASGKFFCAQFSFPGVQLDRQLLGPKQHFVEGLSSSV